MRRISCEERPDWRARAEEIGFDFHTLDGQRYWDERAYYAFTLKEIEQDLEAPTAELEKMSRELVARVIADEQLMRRLAIPVRFWNWIVRSWKKSEPSLYGRFDLRYGGEGPAKLLEYNADLVNRCPASKRLSQIKQISISPRLLDPITDPKQRILT